MTYQRFRAARRTSSEESVANVASVAGADLEIALSAEARQTVASVANVAAPDLKTESGSPNNPAAPPATVATLATVQAKKVSDAPATLATLATVGPTGDGRRQNDEGFEERAAIVEFGANVPREWADGFARLDISRPLPGFTEERWHQLLNDGGRFLDRWATEAARLGWSAEEVFGLDPTTPSDPLRLVGLVSLIGGGQVVDVRADRASIRMANGCNLTYLRRRHSGAVVFWELQPLA